MGRRLAAWLLVGAVTLTGCTTVTKGQGTAVMPLLSASPTFPSTTPSVSARPSSTGPSATASSSPSAGASVALLRAQLAALAPGRALTLVRVGAGWEAAAYDQNYQISFWRHTSSWTRIGASTYPKLPAAYGPPDTVLTGAVLTGMAHATFVAEGIFTGDGSGNAVAYTDGPHGWGAIKAEADGNLASSGQGIGADLLGIENALYLVQGQLETAECSTTIPYSQCGGTKRVLKFWAWNGHDFGLVRRAGLPR